MKKLIIIALLLLPFAYNICAEVSERVYLQTDKSLYIAGELIWLKLYTTNVEGKLQDFSKVGYVELLSDTNPEAQVKLEIKDGVGAGWLELPAMLVTGNYRLSAYTRYMRNEGEEVFFEKMITIINPFQKEDAEDAVSSVNVTTETTPQSSTVRLSIDKNRLGKREKGMITITGLPEEYASLAVSVVGELPFPHENKSVTDWKNNIKQPIRNAKSFLPEYEGTIISAQLMDNETNERLTLQNADALLTFPGKEVQVYSGQRKENGIYNFYTQEITGKKELTTTVFSDSENSYRLDLQSSFASHSPKQMPSFYLDSIWKDYLSMRNLSLQVSIAYTADSMSQIRAIAPFNALAPFRVYVLDEYTRFQNIEEVFIEFILGARIRRVDGKRTFSVINDTRNDFSIGYTLVLLDNIPIVDHDLICDYNALQVERIEIYQGRHIYGERLYDGIIHFKTYKSDYPGIKFENYTQLFDFEGTQPYRYFYSPVYEEGDAGTRMPDFRNTLLWEPLVDSRDGELISIPFYTSDMPGKYDVKVEGISREGKAISATLQIEVTE